MNNLIDKIYFEQDIITSLAIFYIILYAHFNIDLFTCFQRSFITKNIYIQYIIGFFSLYFLVTLFSKTGQLSFVPPIQKLLHTFVYYIIFLGSIRLDSRIMVATIFLILLVYFIQLNITYYEKGLSNNISKKDALLYDNYKYWITFDYPIQLRLIKVNSRQLKLLSVVNNILFFIIICLILFGFICYGGEVKDLIKHNKSLTWIKVITDTSICKIKQSKSLWYYFKTGLGIKF